MRKQVRRRHEAYVRAQNVCAEHSDFFDSSAGGKRARADLGADMAEIDRLLALQARSVEDRRAALQECRLSRRALHGAVKAVVTIGRTVNIDGAGMGTMKLPGGTSDDELVAYARGLVERVSAHADAFVAAGLPSDLLQHLVDGIAAFVAARDAQAASRQRFTAASGSIRETLDSAATTVDVLETIASSTTGAPAEVVTKLRIARRVGPRATAPAQQPPHPAPTDKAA